MNRVNTLLLGLAMSTVCAAHGADVLRIDLKKKPVSKQVVLPADKPQGQNGQAPTVNVSTKLEPC